jgi:hypothetical protein
MSGTDIPMSPTANRALQQRVPLVIAKFLEDKYLETRHHVQNLVKFLMIEYVDYLSVLCSEVDNASLQQ